MRRFALTLVVFLVAVTCNAQEHLRFMDIPLDCSLDVFCNKLITGKGLVVSKMSDGEQYSNMETKKLVGAFYGIGNCSFYVSSHL